MVNSYKLTIITCLFVGFFITLLLRKFLEWLTSFCQPLYPIANPLHNATVYKEVCVIICAAIKLGHRFDAKVPQQLRVKRISLFHFFSSKIKPLRFISSAERSTLQVLGA